MVYLQADDETLLKVLALFVEPVEISDANGKLLGLFIPADLERGKRLYAQAAARSDEEKIAREMASTAPRHPFSETLARLKAAQPAAANGAPGAAQPSEKSPAER
jgi:hypothetical protein